MIKHILHLIFLSSYLSLAFAHRLSDMPDSFDYISSIDPSIIIQPRYAIPGNFVGEVVDGYRAKTAVISKLAGYALTNVQSQLRAMGYSLVVYDAYRPQKGVDHFIRWSEQPQDYKTKAQFYPYIDKETIIPSGYVAKKSGHSRGSTIDLSIIAVGKKIHDIQLKEYRLQDGTVIIYRDDGSEFMCSHFDFFGEASHHDTPLITEQCTEKREILRRAMRKHGYEEYQSQWWHYTLVGQPFPETYFDFDIV